MEAVFLIFIESPSKYQSDSTATSIAHHVALVSLAAEVRNLFGRRIKWDVSRFPIRLNPVSGIAFCAEMKRCYSAPHDCCINSWP